MPGYRDPPAEHRFKKGQSGNPKGGPRGPRSQPALVRCKFLDEKISCSIAGKPFKGQRREALVLAAIALAVSKSNFALQQLLFKLKAQADEMQSHILRDDPKHVISDWPSSPSRVDCIEDAADVAGFGTKAYRNQKSARVLLATWVIEESLRKLGDRRLSRDEQIRVLAATRFPKQVRWPDWWELDLRQRGGGWRAEQNAQAGGARKASKVIRVSLHDQLVLARQEDERWERMMRRREALLDPDSEGLDGDD